MTMIHSGIGTIALILSALSIGNALAFCQPCSSSSFSSSQSLSTPPPSAITKTLSTFSKRRCYSPARVQLYAEKPSSDDGETKNNIPPRRLATNDDPAFLSQDSGGFTVKQRLREEVESPFRKVRLVFFGSSAFSALTALYFSFLNTIKAVQGGYPDAQTLEEALSNDAINLGGVVICGLLAFREYQAGQANLERIAQGGRLASLPLELAVATPTSKLGARKRVGDYRRFSRVVIAVGGQEYMARLCQSLTTADPTTTTTINNIPEKLENTDILVVPVLLSTPSLLGDTKEFWKRSTTSSTSIMNVSRADNIVAFPVDNAAWETYLKSEIETAMSQGFDVLEKGFTIIVKKNGRIMKRATGLPAWFELITTMEIADGSQFGMPGDTERYGGR